MSKWKLIGNFLKASGFIYGIYCIGVVFGEWLAYKGQEVIAE